jgi:hypothetical protein
MERTAPIILAMLVTMGAVRAEAQTVRAIGQERVTVKAESAAIGDLIDQLAAHSSLKFIALDPADRGLRVSVDAEDVGPLDAIVLALKASGLDYAMTGTRLIAGRAKKALESGGPVAWAATSSREVSPPPDTRVHEPRPDFTEQPPPAGASIAASASGATVLSMDGAPEPPAARHEARVAMMLPTFTNDDEFGRSLAVPSVPFVVREDSVLVTQPGFVPYKLRPEVKNRRLFGIADIP